MPFQPLASFVSQLIEYIGLFIVAISSFVALYQLFELPVDKVRQNLARRVLLGLDFIIAAEIIGVSLVTDQNDLIKLAIIVAIRVVLGYSLKKELK